MNEQAAYGFLVARGWTHHIQHKPSMWSRTYYTHPSLAPGGLSPEEAIELQASIQPRKKVMPVVASGVRAIDLSEEDV